MRTPSACRHCKSPKRHDPCWWGIRHVNYNPDAYDPPCFEDDWNEHSRALEVSEMRGLWFALLVWLVIITVIFAAWWATR